MNWDLMLKELDEKYRSERWKPLNFSEKYVFPRVRLRKMAKKEDLDAKYKNDYKFRKRIDKMISDFGLTIIF
jgi:hypothetical protein